MSLAQPYDWNRDERRFDSPLVVVPAPELKPEPTPRTSFLRQYRLTFIYLSVCGVTAMGFIIF